MISSCQNSKRIVDDDDHIDVHNLLEYKTYSEALIIT